MRFLNTPYFKLIAFVFAAFILYVECVVNHNKDLDVFVAASKLVYEGKTCYEVWLHSGTSGLKYFYSPLFAVLLFPIKELPQVACNFVWLGLNLLFVFRIYKLLPAYLPLDKLSPAKKNLFYVLLVVCTARSFYDCFSLGQMTFILVWGTLEAMRLIHSNRALAGSALLALIINIKLIPIALLAYLLYKKEWRATAYTILFSVIYLFLPALFIGEDFNNTLLRDWLSSITQTSGGSIVDDYGRQSLSSFIPALLMDTPIQFNLKRNFVNLEPVQVNLILNLVRLAMLALLIYLFGKPFKKSKNSGTLFYDLALICLATPLIFPHQGKYSFFYLLPAYACCLHALLTSEEVPEEKRKGKHRFTLLALLILSFVLLTLTTDGLLGRRLSDFCEYLNFISLGSFCLLGAMVVIKPKASRD